MNYFKSSTMNRTLRNQAINGFNKTTLEEQITHA